MQPAAREALADAQPHSHDSDHFQTESPSVSPTPRNKDSISRDKERLQRFHKEALSFLMKAYSNDDSVLVEERFNDVDLLERATEDTDSRRRTEFDRVRLEKFHAQAVSFLDHAYADEPDVIVEEEAVSPKSLIETSQEREMLQQFHREAMSFLDVAAEVGGPLGADSVAENVRSPAVVGRKKEDATSSRIERDKERLQQHYNDAMAFLDRTEAEKLGVLVEEQELELAVVDRIKLQKYAQDAMSFLDKAFRNDESVMVGDEEELFRGNQQHALNGGISRGKRNSGIGRHVGPSKGASAGMGKQEHFDRFQDSLSAQAEEDRQIAADRAALERYDEEFGDFLSRAYLDDTSVIVDDAVSSSESEHMLKAREVGPYEHSEDSVSTYDEDDLESAYSDEERLDPPPVESPRVDARHGLVLRKSSFQDEMRPRSRRNATYDRELVQSRAEGHELDETSYIDCTTVSVDGEGYESYGEREISEASALHGPSHVVRRQNHISTPHYYLEDDREHVSFVVPRDDNGRGDTYNSVENALVPRVARDREDRDDHGNTTRSNYEEDFVISDRKLLPQPAASDSMPKTRSTDVLDVVIDLVLQDTKGQSKTLSQVPLEKSFYRQIPRGATIKLCPATRQSFTNETPRMDRAAEDSSDLERMRKERDALTAALEEIINERSMLAAQVSEMKSMVENVGSKETVSTDEHKVTEFSDLAAELRIAHDTMARLTEEMEDTLSVLDARYQEALERALTAEERCIHLESDTSRQEKEFRQQEIRLSHVLAEKNRLRTQLSTREMELRIDKQLFEDRLKQQEDDHRREVDISLDKIRELRKQLSELQGKMSSSTENKSREDEQMKSREKWDEEEKFAAALRSDQNSQKLADMKKELADKTKEVLRFSAQTEHLENKIDGLEGALGEALKERKAAEAEAQILRSKYENSITFRMSSPEGAAAKVEELQENIRNLAEEAGAREKKLHQQLTEFRNRAEQAEAAAAQAERDAKEAYEVAKLAQERCRTAVEAERNCRETLEAELEQAVRERKGWEKLAQQQLESNSKSGEVKTDISGMSGKRGLRRSPSKSSKTGVKDTSRRKRDHGKPSGSGGEESSRKKSSLRPRLFG